MISFLNKAIAVYTFILLWSNKQLRSVVTASIVVGIFWIFDILLSLVLLSTKPDFYTPTPVSVESGVSKQD
jgi:hypothetical protein